MGRHSGVCGRGGAREKRANTSADSQQTPVTGVATDKAQARTDLEDKTLEIADQLSALAVKNGDHDLLAKVQTSKSKALTQSLSELIANVRSIFRNEIDKMMTPYKKSNPDFYNGYFAARVIVNRAASHAAPKKPTPPPP